MASIVHYSHVLQAFDMNESATETSGDNLAGAIDDISPGDDARLRAWVNDGVRGLRDLEVPHADVMATAEDDDAALAVALLQSFIAEMAESDHTGGRLVPSGVTGDEVKFDEQDWKGWAGLALPWLKGKLSKRDFLAPPAEPDVLPNDAKVAILGDWGTGLYGAPACARAVAASDVDLVVHVGDVYYSGTRKEVRQNFLEHWAVPDGAVSRACNSNHEMYSGGEGYFDLTLPAFEQDSSVWACANDDYLLIGLDTAYNDFDLAAGQAEWLASFLHTHQDNRKVILFSHHQLYSLLSKQGSKLQDDLRQLLDERRLFAWYWGHEHRLVLYDRHDSWGLHGRCAGHSGYPYFRDQFGQEPSDPLPGGNRLVHLPATSKSPAGLVLDGPNPFVPGREKDYGANGWLAVELQPSQVVERAMDPHGAELYRQTIE